MNQNDKKYLLYSILFHLSLLLIFTVKVFLIPDVRPELIRSVRVDFVALPDKNPVEAPQGKEKEEKIVEEKPKLAPPPETKKEAANKKEKPVTAKKVEETSSKELQSSAIARLQALSKIKKMQKQKGPEGSIYKGNELSAGSSLTGVEKLQHDQYMENLDLHIKRNWQLPEWLAKKALSAALLVRFDEQGQVLEKRFLRSSGNVTFDKEVMQTIEASVPLPPPPEALISYFKVHGIELRFPE